MLRRFLMICAVGALAGGLCACASHDEQSVADAAREACAAQHFATQAEMDECVNTTETDIQAARDLRNQTPEKPSHGGGGGGGGHGGGRGH